MAKTKTKKKEELVDLKPEKITPEQLEKVQTVINDINKSQIEIGQIETKKHALMHHISALQEAVGEIRNEFEKQYGTADINIQDGIINYPKENGEINKED
jgi:FtsZ-binding cell division protein ZapB